MISLRLPSLGEIRFTLILCLATPRKFSDVAVFLILLFYEVHSGPPLVERPHSVHAWRDAHSAFLQFLLFVLRRRSFSVPA